MRPAGLEARYRGLLRWYPAGHRALHEEEMLGVLMAGARPSQNRPGLTQSADLLIGAARIRLRPGRALSDTQGWRDALAVYSVAALGLRRWAAAAAAVSALSLGTTAVLQLHTPLSVGLPISLLYIPFALLAPISETVALLAAPGPRRGRQLIRRREWALLAAGSALAAVLTRDFGFALLRLGGESLHRNVSLLAELAAALLLLALWLSSAAGKRLAFLFGVLAYGLLLTDGLIDGTGPWDAATINGSIGQVLVAFALAAVVYRSWRRSRSVAESAAT
jgi:hypothetical protein